MYRHRLRNIFRSASFPVFEYGPDHFYVTSSIIGELRELEYFDQWRKAIQSGWFHVRLEDHSIFIFNESAASPSLSFLPSPIVCESFREFLASKDVDYTARNRSMYLEEYQLVIETAQLREHVQPIRFDFDPAAYREAIHPLAHLHVGIKNNIRIAFGRQMSAESFVLFVMRQAYPECWERLLAQAPAASLMKTIRLALPAVPPDRWTEVDRLELHLA
jgi:hypothetical protein